MTKTKRLLEAALSVLLRLMREEQVPMEDIEDAALDIGEFLMGHEPENN